MKRILQVIVIAAAITASGLALSTEAQAAGNCYTVGPSYDPVDYCYLGWSWGSDSTMYKEHWTVLARAGNSIPHVLYKYYKAYNGRWWVAGCLANPLGSFGQVPCPF